MTPPIVVHPVLFLQSAMPNVMADNIRARIAHDPERYQRTGLSSFSIDAAGKCQQPVGFETYGHISLPPGHPGGMVAIPQDGVPVILRGDARCRRCDACLKARAREWTARAIRETTYASRTWFGTITLSPDWQQWHLESARQRARTAGYDLDADPYGVQFMARVASIGLEITRYLKRVRKDSGCRLRYLWVAEHHASGLPHFHCLVHEIAGTITKRVLQGQWKQGFTQFKLVDEEKPKAAAYVCKYLSKASVARVRASLRYGNEPSARIVGQAFIAGARVLAPLAATQSEAINRSGAIAGERSEDAPSQKAPLPVKDPSGLEGPKPRPSKSD